MKILNIIIVAFMFSFLNMGCTRPLSEKIQTVDGKRPNIIFILTDDQRWDALGFAGNQIIQTPNMDELASMASILKMHLLQHQSVQQAVHRCLQDYMNGPIILPLGNQSWITSIWKRVTPIYSGSQDTGPDLLANLA